MISNAMIYISRNDQKIIVLVTGKVIHYRDARIDLIADFTSNHELTNDELVCAENALIASARANFQVFHLTD